MDGALTGPLLIGETTQETFLKDCVPVVQGYFDRDKGNTNFGVTVLAKTMN
jgi:hypothetical protein